MKRKHFFEGMFPTTEDFNELQDNVEEAINQAAVAITGQGILEGFGYAWQSNNTQLVIHSGKAIDKNGSLLQVPQETVLTWQVGYVVLRHTKTNVGTEFTITQQPVWKTQEDTAQILIVSSPASNDIKLYYTSSKGNLTLYANGSSRAPAYSYLRDIIRGEIVEAKNQAIDIAIPPGFIYTQYPGQKAPQAGTYTATKNKQVTILSSDALGWPGTWELTTEYANAFFRAEGEDNSKDSNSKLDTGAQPFEPQTRTQHDAGRNIQGKFRGHWRGNSDIGGAFYSDHEYHYAHDFDTSDADSTMSIANFNASREWGTSHTSNEFRPKNYTVRIWKRIS